jgi:hypothetical protein
MIEYMIPRLTPDVIEAEAKKCYDREKVATTSIKCLVVSGVEITSRWARAEDYELMVKIMEAIPPAVARKDKVSVMRWLYDLFRSYIAAMESGYSRGRCAVL